MTAPKKTVVRKRPGRPATGQAPVTAIRLSSVLRENVDTWAAGQEDRPGRSEAIRRLVELGLTVQRSETSSTGQRARAAVLAGRQIDQMGDATAPNDEQATRKRRLIKGPSAFRDVRVDRPKAKRK